jgi:serine/threonine protein kinase/tetratricopeptide (TPR) repeat protein
MDPGTVIDHYEILSRLGEGGMGVVYRARDRKLDREVALKFLPSHLSGDPDSNDRFMQEARAASALNHPNVCSIYDIKETDDGRLYIVMPLYAGKTLKYRLQDGPVRRDMAVNVARQIAEGLSAAHQKGIVHRDIKPANIMVTDDGHVVILDFGLAKLTGGLDLTRSGSTLGTAYYMSPEQIRGEPVDHRTDIWAVGVLMYEMLAGRRPFEGDYEQAVSYAILNHEPSLELEPDVNAVLSKCLSKDAADRFESTEDLVSSLRRLSSPSGEIPQNAIPRRRPTRLKRIGWIATAVVAVLLAILFGTRSGDSIMAPSEPEEVRLVVLPFDNLGASEDAYFADGITEEITTRLASLSGMAVISQNTASRYRDTEKTISTIGAELDVNYVLSGSVRWDKRSADGELVRISPRLIRVRDDTNVWTQTYERTIEGIFAIQTEVAEDVASELNVTLLDNEIERISRLPTDNIEAYHAYLQGIAITRDRTLGRLDAISHFTRAVELDPDFLEAQYALGNVYLLGAWIGTPADWDRYSPLAVEVAGKVHELAPDSPEDHLLRGFQAYYADLDFERAREHFIRANEMAPEDAETLEPLAWISRRLGLFTDATNILHDLLERDPLNYSLIVEAVWTNVLLRRHSRTDQLIGQAILIQPENRQLYCARSWNQLLASGDIATARQFEEMGPDEADHLPCWWADLADRRFETILDKLGRVDPDVLGTHYYGTFFTHQRSHFHFRRAMMARYLGDATLEREAWMALRTGLSEQGSGEYDLERYRNNQAVSTLGHAIASAGLGEVETSRRLLENLRRGTQHDKALEAQLRTRIALAYTLLGDVDEAVTILALDFERPGLVTGPWLAMPFWDPLREHPGFQELVRRHGAVS